MVEPEKWAALLIVGTGMMLAGCTATEFAQSTMAPPMTDLSQPNYHRIVFENVKKTFPNLPAGDLEISGLRPVNHLKGPAWLTCLRVDPGGNPQQYAIFIQNDA